MNSKTLLLISIFGVCLMFQLISARSVVNPSEVNVVQADKENEGKVVMRRDKDDEDDDEKEESADSDSNSASDSDDENESK